MTETGLAGAAAGALYTPEEVTVPAAEVPPGVPFTSHVTAVLLVPETLALNCCDCPTCKVEELGEMETETFFL